jgi:hypothetical protein
MTREPNGNEVQLSLRDLLALASGVVVIIGASWGFTLRVQSSIDVIGERTEHMIDRIETLEKYRDVLPWLKGFQAGKDAPNPPDQLTP